MLRKSAIILLLISLLGIISCEYSETTTMGEAGASFKDEALMSRFKAGLEKEGIPFRIETAESGEIQLLWDSIYSERIEELENSFMGLAPKNTEGLCFENEEARERLTIRLKENSIPFNTRTSFDGMKCAYWELAYDDSVARVYPNWGEMREFRKEKQSNKSLKERDALTRAP